MTSRWTPPQADAIADALHEVFGPISSPSASISARCAAPGDPKPQTSTRRDCITRAEWKRHARGERRYGPIPFLGPEHDQVRWACIDMDTDEKHLNLAEDAARALAIELRDTLRAAHVHPTVEASKSRGFHFWVIFDEQVPAAQARGLLLPLVAKVLPAWAKLTDCVTPRGPRAEVGNGIWAPCNGFDAGLRTMILSDSLVTAPEDQAAAIRAMPTTAAELALLAPPLDPGITGRTERAAGIGSSASAELDPLFRSLNAQRLRDFIVRARAAGADLRVGKFYGSKVAVRCEFHASSRSEPNAVIFAERLVFFCSSCGAKTVGLDAFLTKLEAQ